MLVPRRFGVVVVVVVVSNGGDDCGNNFGCRERESWC